MKMIKMSLLLLSIFMGMAASLNAQTTSCQSPNARTTVAGVGGGNGNDFPEMVSIMMGGTSPSVELHAKGSILFQQLCSGNYIPVTSTGFSTLEGTYMYWDQFLGAFRSGTISTGNSYWDGPNVGANSMAHGYNTKASGENSFASGHTSAAQGVNSFAIGQTTLASGTHSFAGGQISTASANYSFSFGYSNLSSALYSVSFGYGNSSTGGYSFTTGYNGTASADYSMTVGNSNQASGSASFAGGTSSTASNDNAFAFGFQTIASGNRAFAVNNKSKATGESSCAVNTLTTASGAASFAQGEGTIAAGDYSSSFGISTTATADGSFSQGNSSIASGVNSVAIGLLTVASGVNSMATGRSTIATGNQSGAFGYGATAGGISAFAFGNNSQAGGDYSFSSGNASIASGESSFASGHSTTASGNFSFACGDNTTASGNFSFAAIAGSTASSPYSVSIGQLAIASSNNAIALGTAAKAYATNSIALGNNTQVGTAGTNAIAIGAGITNNVSNTLSIGFNNGTALPSINVGDGTVLNTGNVAIGTTVTGSKLTVLAENTSSSNTYAAFLVRNTNVSYSDLFRIKNSGEAIVGFTGSVPSNPAKLHVISDGNHTGNVTFQVQHFNGSTSQELMYVHKFGNIGLGTAAPQNRLHLDVGTSTSLYSQVTNTATGSTSSDGFTVGIAAGGDAELTQQENSDMIFSTNAAQRMWLKNDGKIGVGTSTPSFKMHLHIGAASDIFTGYTNTNSPAGFAIGVDGAGYATLKAIDWAPMVFYTDALERMRISQDGYVGIGTNSPQEKLQIYSNGSTPVYSLTTNGTTGASNTDGLKIGVDANGNAQILQQENLAMWFSTNSNERMRILAGGNVGIGTSTPVAKLAVEGNVYPQTDGSYDLGTVTALSGTDYRWNNICAVNSVIQTSDRNKKKNIEELKYGISDIMKLRPVTFEWISNNNGRRIGLIAQEVQPIINEIVIGEDGKGMGMMYTELIPVLIKGMQEQQQMIAEQQQQIILLQNQIVDLYGLGNISQTKQYKDSLGIQSQTILLQEGPKLFQNIPNPFDLTTVIHYYLPKGTFNATLKIFDSSGKELVQYKLFNCGYSFVNVESVNMPSGSYTYSLIIGDKVIDTMKMIISK